MKSRFLWFTAAVFLTFSLMAGIMEFQLLEEDSYTFVNGIESAQVALVSKNKTYFTNKFAFPNDNCAEIFLKEIWKSVLDIDDISGYDVDWPAVVEKFLE